MSTPLEDLEFLARSDHRVNALGALSVGPQKRADLRVATGASNATVGRILSDFENRRWIRRDEHRYELTTLGEFIADGFFDVVERFETEHSIRDVWRWFPTELGFTIEMFAGATVTRPNEGNPYSSNSRYIELVDASTTLREMGRVPLKPENVKAVLEQAVAGTAVELVFDEESLLYMLGREPELANKALASGRLVLLTHDDLPGGLAIFDDCVGTCCRDYETGLSRAIIDTDTTEALDHARALYNMYRQDALLFEADVLTAS